MAGKTENHVVKFSPSNWEELRRVAKNHRRTESEVVDDLLAMSGDLDALYDQKGEPQPFTPEKVEEPSTRAAVLEPSPAELDDIIGDPGDVADLIGSELEDLI